MLVLTANATSAILGLLDRPSLPKSSGVRIHQEGEDDTLVLTRADGPEPGDYLYDDNRGTRLFLGPRAAAVLDEKVLDAHLTSAGKVQFVVEPQR